MTNVQRVQIPVAFQYLNGSGKIIPAPASTAVTVTDRNTLSATTVFSAATGGGTIASPITDVNGNIPGWVIEGSYTLACAAVPGATPAYPGASVGWEAVRGDGVESIYPGTVTTAHLSSVLAQSLLPTGVIVDYTGTIPTGFVACDGALYATTGTYAALFGVIGYSFGGTGTNFNVPDLRGRTTIGAGTGSGLSTRVVGAWGGEEAHGHTGDEMPIHAHGVTDPTHSHSVFDPGHQHYVTNYTGTVSSNHYHQPSNNSGAFNGWFQDDLNGLHGDGQQSMPYGGPSGVITIHNTTDFESNDHVHGWNGVSDVRGSNIGVFGNFTGCSLQNAGSGTPHTVMQPWITFNKMIKL